MFSIYWPYYILYYVGGFCQPLCSCIHVVLHIIKLHSSSIQKPCAIRLKFARWNPLPLPFVHKLKSIYCLFMYLWIKISQIKMKIPPTAPTPTMKKAENVFNKWNYLASISLQIYVIQCFLICLATKMEQKTEQSLEEVLGFLLTHPFLNAQVVVLFSPALPIPNTQMELHRDSNQPRTMTI